jgi:hypothetical protein
MVTPLTEAILLGTVGLNPQIEDLFLEEKPRINP